MGSINYSNMVFIISKLEGIMLTRGCTVHTVIAVVYTEDEKIVEPYTE